MKPEELKRQISMLREIHKLRADTLNTLKDLKTDHGALISSMNQLSRKSNEGNLAKIGLTLLAFPFPIVIDDLLGWPLLIAGLVQRKIKNSALYVDDPSRVFSNLQKELADKRLEIL